jgi:hypothetical protein
VYCSEDVKGGFNGALPKVTSSQSGASSSTAAAIGRALAVLDGAVHLLESHGISLASCVDPADLEYHMDDVRLTLSTLQRFLTTDRRRWAPHMNPAGVTEPDLTSTTEICT